MSFAQQKMLRDPKSTMKESMLHDNGLFDITNRMVETNAPTLKQIMESDARI